MQAKIRQRSSRQAEVILITKQTLKLVSCSNDTAGDHRGGRRPGTGSQLFSLTVINIIPVANYVSETNNLSHLIILHRMKTLK